MSHLKSSIEIIDGKKVFEETEDEISEAIQRVMNR